jgi:hypothetical protein
MEVKLDDQHSLIDECDDEENFSRDLQHQEELYSLAKSREKYDRKAPKMNGFKDMVSFAFC